MPHKLAIACLVLVLSAGVAALGLWATTRLGRTPPGATRVAPQDDMPQVYVPAGPFIMGDSDATALAEYQSSCVGFRCASSR